MLILYHLTDFQFVKTNNYLLEVAIKQITVIIMAHSLMVQPNMGVGVNYNL